MAGKKTQKKTTKVPHLKLIQGGKSDKAPKPKVDKPEKTQKVHPFANFMGKGNHNPTSGKPNSFENVVHHQIPRKKVI